MLQGKVNGALRLLSRCENGGVLSLDDLIPTGNEETVQRTTRDVLLDKHPDGRPAPDEALRIQV